MKKISICIPVINEQENIVYAYNEICKIFKEDLKNYNYEIVFTDNNSSDRTQELITSICENNINVKYIRFKTNLGYDKSVLEAYKNSAGDAAIVIDCDLQDPPAMIRQLVEKWEDGYDLVYGIANKRNENFIKKYLRNFFYYLMKNNADFKYPKNAHGFRLVDRAILDDLKYISNLYPYIRGLTYSLSKKPIGIDYNRSRRSKGSSKLGFYKSYNYAINAFLEETFLFTKFFRRLSLLFLLVFILFSIFNLLNKFSIINFLNNLYLGLLVFICSFLAIILEYLNRIYFQIKNSKRVIYEKTKNL